MTKIRKSNQIEINALLNTFSVKEITDMFSTIEDKIISLHSCSSNDFQMLNASFKEIYRLGKISDQSINQLTNKLDQLNSDKSNSLFSGVNQNIIKYLKKKYLERRWLENTLKNLSKKVNAIFIPLKNHNQDLMSLKLLLTNLNFYESIENKGSANLGQVIENAEKLVVECKLLTEKKYKELNALRKKTKTVIEEVILLGKIQQKLTKSITCEAGISLRMLKEFEKLVGYKSLQTKRHNDLGVCVDNIITNLQYHDIIRQKMEHIQRTHNDFLKELEVFNNKFPQKKFINEKAKQFIRVRDISGLHAAKLVQTNKEYRQAIEIIVKSFLKINSIILKNTEFIQKPYMRINHMVEKDAGKNGDLTIILKQFESKYNKVYQLLVSLQNEFIGEDESTKQLWIKEDALCKLLNRHFDDLQIALKQNKNAQYNLKQILLYISVLGSGSELNNKFVNPLVKLLADIQKVISELQKPEVNYISKTKITSLINKIYHDYKTIFGQMDENGQVNKQLLDNINSSISSIKYYGFFDSTITEIINILSSINIRLKSSYSGYIETKTENLDHLKNYYTMETEHKLHDQVLKKGKTRKGGNQNNLEIEFF